MLNKKAPLPVGREMNNEEVQQLYDNAVKRRKEVQKLKAELNNLRWHISKSQVASPIMLVKTSLVQKVMSLFKNVYKFLVTFKYFKYYKNRRIFTEGFVKHIDENTDSLLKDIVDIKGLREKSE